MIRFYFLFPEYRKRKHRNENEKTRAKVCLVANSKNYREVGKRESNF
jgi:hypothetical protein